MQNKLSLPTAPDAETAKRDLPTVEDVERSQSACGRQRIATQSLDPESWGELRIQAHRMLDDMLDYTQRIRRQPVWQQIPQQVRDRFRQELPVLPTPLEQVHEEFLRFILPYTARNGHPGFMGWVQGGGTPVGALAEMLSAWLNANLGGRDQIPVEVERQITEWMRAVFGFPEGASGVLVTGTSMANFIAVKVARDARLGCEVRRKGLAEMAKAARLVAYASTEAHTCVARAMDMTGLGSDALRRIGVDRRHRMDLQALSAQVAHDRGQGFMPFLVVGTAGAVDTGAIDDLSGAADLCAREQMWFHVDGAFGALAMLCPELGGRLHGIERADSLAFDFHKWAQVPFDAGFVLVRDGALQQAAFDSSAAYLAREQRGVAAGSVWPCDLGPDLSRSFRALKVWVTLKVYGTKALGDVVSQTCRLARYLESRVADTPQLQMMAPVELNIVCFRYRGALGIEAQERELTADRAKDDVWLDALNREVVIALQEAGAVVPSTTRIRGRVVIRAAIVNHRTTQTEIDTLLESVLDAGGRLARRMHEQPS
ncbi:MAG: pyridoxal phosphate-dependent decarboxylase family protein [Acidobacteriaceae bacterium]